MALTQAGARRGERIGVLGGTYDPIHFGHLIVAEEARVRLGLSQVLFVPARVSPLKQERELSAACHRRHMVELAISGNPAFAVSTIDLERCGPSYTVDTLAALRERMPRATLYFIMGMDSLLGLRAWRAPERIMALARLVVVTRPGHAPDWFALEAELPGIRSAVDLLEGLAIGISSTDLRRRARLGLPIRYQVPDAVAAYIESRGLYREHETGDAPRAEREPPCC